MSEPDDADKEITLSVEITDRALKKEQKRKLKEKTQAGAQKEIDPEADDNNISAKISSGKLAAGKKAQRKKYFKYGSCAAVFGVLAWLINFLFAPYTAGMTYGICKTYLELNVRFPDHLRISTVEDYGEYVRIWYTQLDAFGEYRLQNIQCNYRADEVTGAALSKVTIDRREEDPAKISQFNASIGIILENPPDLEIPAPLPNKLENLQVNSNLFRRQLF